MPKAYELPLPGEAINSEIFYLGKPCKRAHDWGGGQTLRFINNRNCPFCSRIDSLERLERKRAADPQAYKSRQAKYVREKRARFGRPSQIGRAHV